MQPSSYKKPIIVRTDGSIKYASMDFPQMESQIPANPHHDPAVRLALIESKVETQTKVVDKLVDSITSIREVAKNMQEIVKIHELKLEQRAEGEKGLYAYIKKEHDHMSERIKRVENDGETTYRELSDQIKQLREENQAQMDTFQSQMKETITNSLSPLVNDMEAIKRKNDFYDKVRWVVLGAAIIGVLLAPGGVELLTKFLR